MQIVWAVSCEQYELTDDGTANIFGAGFDTLRVEELPAELEISVLVRFLLDEDEHGEIDVHVLGPATAPLAELKHAIEPRPGPNHRPGYLVSQIEALELV